MRQENEIINIDFKNAIKETFKEASMGAGFSYRKLEPSIKLFAQSDLAKLDYELCSFYKDKNYHGLSHNTLLRLLDKGGKGSQEIIDLLSYYVYGRDYITSVNEGKVAGCIPAFQLLKRNRKTQRESIIGAEQHKAAFKLDSDIINIQKQKELEKIQKQLNTKFNQGFHGGIFTAYHVERCKCSIYTTKPTLIEQKNDFFLINDTSAWQQLFSKVTGRGDKKPAGGWYLIYEQRKFLQEQLELIFKHQSGTEITICEAGCASFVHHFTFVSIIIDALRASKRDIKVKLYVVDEYLFPLYQVLEVLDKVITNRQLYPMTFLEMNDSNGNCLPEFNVASDFIDFINSEFGIKYYNKYIQSTEFLHKNLCETQEMPKLDFDIITEHFLMKQDSDADTLKEWLDKFSNTYRHFAPTGKSLHLISAIGEKANDLEGDYFNLYKKKGFQLESHEKVWDIHDQNYYYGNQVDKSIPYRLKNHLIYWKYLRST